MIISFLDAAGNTSAVVTHNLRVNLNSPQVSLQAELAGSLLNVDRNFQVRAVDTAGNISNVQEKLWSVDTIAPLKALSASVSGMSATFGLSANEACVTYLCALNGAALPVSLHL